MILAIQYICEFGYKDDLSATNSGKNTKDKNKVSEQLHRAQEGIFDGEGIISSRNDELDVHYEEEKDKHHSDYHIGSRAANFTNIEANTCDCSRRADQGKDCEGWTQ